MDQKYFISPDVQKDHMCAVLSACVDGINKGLEMSKKKPYRNEWSVSGEIKS